MGLRDSQSALLITINSMGCNRGAPHPLLPMPGAEAPSSTPLDPPMSLVGTMSLFTGIGMVCEMYQC